MKFASSEEPFVLISDVMCISPWPLTIETSHLGLVSKFQIRNSEFMITTAQVPPTLKTQLAISSRDT